MFHLNYLEFKERYKDVITSLWDEAYTAIIVDSKEGHIPNCDMIVNFSPQGEMIIITERVNKGDMSKLQWFLQQRRMNKIRKSLPKQEGVDVSINIGDDFIDLMQYKRWWYEWAREL